MLYHVHTFIAIYFHISFIPVSTHSINQNNYYNYVSSKSINCRNSMTDYAQKNIHTISKISQNVAVLSWLVMLVVGLIDIEHNAVCNQRFFFFFFFFFSPKIATIYYAVSNHSAEGVRKKSQLCIRAIDRDVSISVIRAS